jgi:CheY-like chemotaxis protein
VVEEPALLSVGLSVSAPAQKAQLPGFSWSIRGATPLGASLVTSRTSSSVPSLRTQAMEGVRAGFLAAGFDGYVSKPVDIVEPSRS